MEMIADELKCIIETQDGAVCGYMDRTEEGTVYKFKGIPYAKPPLGPLRFFPPSPIRPWSLIKDCTREAPLPLQYNLVTKEILGSEDCLYLEIYTPTLQSKKPLPVMFWIGCHAFTFSLDSIYDPTTLNAQDVVFVRCGFRLGPFGFLSLHDFTAPGNCGLKDIVMALNWTQRNISAFGGDPNNVTIFGSSTGGAIVHLMMVSPMATGLFHKGIIQSVGALNSWLLSKNPSQTVINLCKLLDINKTNKNEIIEDLRSLPALDIIEAFVELFKLRKTIKERDIVDAMMKPCIELDFEGQPTFITRSPASLIKSGNFNKVPFIIGSNNIEASLLEFIKNDFYDDFEKMNEDADLLLPRTLAGGGTELSQSIGQQLLNFYLAGQDHLTADTKAQYLQLISDYYFLYYINKTVRLHTQAVPECPIYYYIVNFPGNWVVPDSYKFFNSLGHSAETPFIFRIKLPNSEACKGSRESVTTRNKVVKMWTNFAKYGNPTPDENDRLLLVKWDPIGGEDKLNYLSIGSELTKGRNPFQERMEFWDNLHHQHTFLRTVVYFNDMGIQW